MVLCQILVEKFPPNAIQRNIWANKLKDLVQENRLFDSYLNEIRLSKNTNSNRELKFKVLKRSNDKCKEQVEKIIDIGKKDKQVDSVFDHGLFKEIEDIVQKIHGDDLENHSLSRCVDRLGKSLREDYDEDFK